MAGRSSLGLVAAFRAPRGASSGGHALGPFAWHGMRRTVAPSQGYERLVLPATVPAEQRRALRSLASAAGLNCEAWGPPSARRLSLALQSECSCCVNALSFPSDTVLRPAALCKALFDAFGIEVSEVDIT
mmetsp:Transcript_63746/g.137127  ORF Transcript_63746/g.137127 Transcript_63746/m.137127 type:complete len:130 (-) Transcript_63746:71-460(-)